MSSRSEDNCSNNLNRKSDKTKNQMNFMQIMTNSNGEKYYKCTYDTCSKYYVNYYRFKVHSRTHVFLF